MVQPDDQERKASDAQYMLDTNIVICTMKRRSQAVCEAFRKHYGQICISCFIRIELVDGAERSIDQNAT